METIRIFIAGWGVLIIAILLNILASRFGVDTWFSLSEEVRKVGFVKALQNENFVEIAFQFVIYPLLLGLTAYCILKTLN